MAGDAEDAERYYIHLECALLRYERAAWPTLPVPRRYIAERDHAIAAGDVRLFLARREYAGGYRRYYKPPVLACDIE